MCTLNGIVKIEKLPRMADLMEMEGIMLREFADITCLACGRDLGGIELVEKSVRYAPPPPAERAKHREAGPWQRETAHLRTLRWPGADRLDGAHSCLRGLSKPPSSSQRRHPPIARSLSLATPDV